MLRHTFQHLRGITSRREGNMWNQGVLDWIAFRNALDPQPSLFGDSLREHALGQQLNASEAALSAGDASLFARQLDKREHFRICLAFPRETLFLDIETTGLSRYYDHITVIGWALGPQYGFFVKGQDDGAFRQALAAAKAVVTFNGSLFDLPFIAHEFPAYAFPAVHVDLRFLGKRAGFSGGQKQIERLLGIARKAELANIAGEAAPILWNEYTRGDLESLRLLLEYNASDIWGMKQIFDVVVRRVLESYGFPLHVLPQPEMKGVEFPDRQAKIQQAIASSVSPWLLQDARKLRLEDLVYVDRPPRLKVVGIDLTGSESRPSGWCILDGREVSTATLGGDEEIVARTIKERPDVVSIDSPLTLPDGRISVHDDDPGRHVYGIMRFSERVLKKRGVNVYPALIPSMQRLTARGIKLASTFRLMGFPVIESYPGAAQDIMGIPRKRKGLEYLEQGLAEFGVSGAFIKEQLTHDELDAITSAIVGVFFWAGRVERLGSNPLDEEALMIPDLRVDPADRQGRLVIGLSGALGAGKTTAAEHLQSLGCEYVRYSQVIARQLKEKKPNHTREDLQVEGQRVHVELGQRWLGRELLRPVFQRRFVVVDGLRFPEDHAFLTEIFGSQFLHIHVVARRDLRKARFEQREGVAFESADAHAVEARGKELKLFARDVVENNGSVDNYRAALDKVLRRNWR
jgi:uncharacterized protein YprB with RNaseH-like and TPR domain/predicted nuclease with RNAse H fold/dephospho-CoA kinase